MDISNVKCHEVDTIVSILIEPGVLKKRNISKRKSIFSQFQGKMKKIKGSSSCSLIPIIFEQETPINNLDYDCLERVFVYLPVEERLRVGQVCKKWREASQFIWADVKILEYKDEQLTCSEHNREQSCHCHLTSDEIKLKFHYIPNLFLHCGQYVQDLDISKFNNSIILRALKGCFPNLLRLTIRIHQWEDEDIKDLFNGMTKLEYLDIGWCHLKVFPQKILFKAVSSVIDTLKEIWINSLPHAHPASKPILHMIHSYFLPIIPRLQSLHTFGMHGIAFTEILVNAIGRLKNLNFLILGDTAVFDETMYPILNFINLKKLHLGWYSKNIDGFLMEFPDKLKNLTDITLQVAKITDVGVLALTKLEKLVSIAFECRFPQLRVTDASITKFKNLQAISIFNCPMITDNSTRHLLIGSPNLDSMSLRNSAVTVESIYYIIDTMRTRTKDNRLRATLDFLEKPTYQVQGKIPCNLNLKIQQRTR